MRTNSTPKAVNLLGRDTLGNFVACNSCRQQVLQSAVWILLCPTSGMPLMFLWQQSCACILCNMLRATKCGCMQQISPMTHYTMYCLQLCIHVQVNHKCPKESHYMNKYVQKILQVNISVCCSLDIAWCLWCNAVQISEVTFGINHCLSWHWIWYLHTHTHIYIYIYIYNFLNIYILLEPNIKDAGGNINLIYSRREW